jgi:hypothetical protein
MKKLNPNDEYIVKGGKPTAIILPIEEYQALLEDLEVWRNITPLNFAVPQKKN